MLAYAFPAWTLHLGGEFRSWAIFLLLQNSRISWSENFIWKREDTFFCSEMDAAEETFRCFIEAENYDYNRDRGFDRIIERAFPIKAVFFSRSQILICEIWYVRAGVYKLPWLRFFLMDCCGSKLINPIGSRVLNYTILPPWIFQYVFRNPIFFIRWALPRRIYPQINGPKESDPWVVGPSLGNLRRKLQKPVATARCLDIGGWIHTSENIFGFSII